MEEYCEREIDIITHVKKVGNKWIASQKVYNARKLSPEIDWEVRNIEVSSDEKEKQADALDEVNLIVSKFLESVGYDLFNYIENERKTDD